ncbi:MAG: hypothetical protein KDD48_05915 [Bdellovibrionales bacterium]|nr:hypothetical protein [Bdellovibrionales bacterium]
MSILCCTGDPGRIPISLDFTQVTNTSQIQRFLFVVKEPADPIGLAILFPDECTGCTVSETPCPAANSCVKVNACGFLVTDEGFEARVDFSDFDNGADIEIIACATNGIDTIIASGATVIKNTGGQEAQVALSDSDTSCDLLPQCP